MSEFDKLIASVLSRTALQQSDVIRAKLKEALQAEKVTLQQTLMDIAIGDLAPKQFDQVLSDHTKQVLSHFADEPLENLGRLKILVQTTLFELAKSALHTYSC